VHLIGILCPPSLRHESYNGNIAMYSLSDLEEKPMMVSCLSRTSPVCSVSDSVLGQTKSVRQQQSPVVMIVVSSAEIDGMSHSLKRWVLEILVRHHVVVKRATHAAQQIFTCVTQAGSTYKILYRTAWSSRIQGLCVSCLSWYRSL
jgi:hypothetical protein